MAALSHSNQDALTQLRDIHLPSPLGWWPPALGWVILVVLLLCFVSGLVFWWWRSYSYGREKHDALRLLATYEAQYRLHPSRQEGSAFVSELLKRIALVYYPRVQVASLKGEAWIGFLNESAKGLDFHAVSDALLYYPYQPSPAVPTLKSIETADELDTLFELVRAWIKQRRKPCLN